VTGSNQNLSLCAAFADCRRSSWVFSTIFDGRSHICTL